MKKRKQMRLTIIVALALLALIAVSLVIYKIVAPSNEKRDLNSIFKVEDKKVAVVVDDELQEQYAQTIDGHIYVPADMATTHMDKRIYVDGKENILSYATSTGLITAEADTKEFLFGKEKKVADAPILRKTDNGLVVSWDFVKEHAACYYKEYKNPSRIVVMFDRELTYTFAWLNSDTRVRCGPGKKYPYYAEVPEGGKVFVQTDGKEENEYVPVSTEDGVTGYIPKDRVEKTEEKTWKFDKTPESFSQQSIGETVCLGWHQMTNETGSSYLPTTLNQATSLNVLSPTWYALSDNNGNFTSYANSAYVSQAHAKGLKVWALINDFNVGKGVELTKVLGTTSNRTKLVNNLVASAITYNLDGINVDFEKVTKDTAKAYLQFLRELTLKCHANDLVVSVDNYTPADYNAYYDLEEQGRIVDYVILMAYDEHYSGSEKAGSVSSLPFVENGVKSVLTKVPKERMVTALPFYARLWKVVKGKAVSSEAYGMSGAESVVRANDTTPKWDKKTGQYYAQYKSSGATYKIWLEEETSLEKKLNVVKANKCAGVAFWKLGFERAVTWTTIKNYTK